MGDECAPRRGRRFQIRLRTILVDGANLSPHRRPTLNTGIIAAQRRTPPHDPSAHAIGDEALNNLYLEKFNAGERPSLEFTAAPTHRAGH